MARIDDELEPHKMRVMNLDGVSVEEFVSALRVLEQSADVRDKRIIYCSVRNPGNLILVETGWQHGGCNGGGEWVLLERDNNGWRIDGIRQWRS
jgi:hypothetical protein